MFLSFAAAKRVEPDPVFLAWLANVQSEFKTNGLEATFLNHSHLKSLFERGRTPETVAELAYRIHEREMRKQRKKPS
jgi:hypothetical protein